VDDFSIVMYLRSNEVITVSYFIAEKIVKVLRFKTILAGIIGPSFFPATKTFIFKSPSLITHGSYLYGLPDNLDILTIGGKIFGFGPSSVGHGYVLHGLVGTSSPTHGLPPFFGGTHI
jgi:hypothetical protein